MHFCNHTITSLKIIHRAYHDVLTLPDVKTIPYLRGTS